MVGIHQGLLDRGGLGVAGGRRSASSQTDDPTDRLTFCGGFNSWGGGGSAADQPGGEPRRRGGMKAELEGVKFSAEKVKNKSKGESKVETGRRRDEAVTTADLDSTLVGFFGFFSGRGLPRFWRWAQVRSSELTPNPGC